MPKCLPTASQLHDSIITVPCFKLFASSPASMVPVSCYNSRLANTNSWAWITQPVRLVVVAFFAFFAFFASLPYYFNLGRLNATRLTKWLWIVASSHSFWKSDIPVPFGLLKFVTFAIGWWGSSKQGGFWLLLQKYLECLLWKVPMN